MTSLALPPNCIYHIGCMKNSYNFHHCQLGSSFPLIYLDCSSGSNLLLMIIYFACHPSTGALSHVSPLLYYTCFRLFISLFLLHQKFIYHSNGPRICKFDLCRLLISHLMTTTVLQSSSYYCSVKVLAHG